MTTVTDQLTEAPDGTWSVVLARPSARLSIAELTRSAGALVAWPIMWPESDESVRRRGPIPAAPSQLAGEVLESRWDPGRRAVVGRISVVDKLASLLRRIPNALRLQLSVPPGALVETAGELGHFVVMTKGGRASGAGRLLEAAVSAVDPEPRRVPMPDVTLAEALMMPEVKRYIGGIVSEHVSSRRLDPSEEREMRIQESVAAGEPVRFLGDDSPVAQRMRRKGLDPAHFGATPPDAA